MIYYVVWKTMIPTANTLTKKIYLKYRNTIYRRVTTTTLFMHDPDYAPNTDFFVQDYYHCDAAIDFQMQQHDDMAVPFMVVFKHSEISIDASPMCDDDEEVASN